MIPNIQSRPTTRKKKRRSRDIHQRKTSDESVVLSASSDGVVKHILCFDHMRLEVVVVYRLPSCEMENFGPAISHISSKLEELGNSIPTVVVMGDFNFPSMSWPAGHIRGLYKKYPTLCREKKVIYLSGLDT